MPWLKRRGEAARAFVSGWEARDGVALVPLLFLLAIGAPYLNQSTSLDPMVLYGESAAFYSGGLHAVQQLGTPLHPPLLYLLNALSFLLFGRRPLSYSLTGIILFGCTSIYSYAFLKARFGRRVAAPFVLLLFCNPMVVLNSLLLSNDALILFGFMLAVLLCFDGRNPALAAVLCAVMLMKETAILCVFLLFLYSLYRRTYLRDQHRRRRSYLRLVELFGPALLTLLAWRIVLWRTGYTEWREESFVKGSQNSYLLLAHKLAALHVWDIFSRQNLRNAFVLNFQWVYLLACALLLAIFWRRVLHLPRSARRLLVMAVLISGLYALLVFPFPTFTIPRYGLPAYFGLFLLLALLLGLVRQQALYGSCLALLLVVTVLGNLGSFDPVSNLYGGTTVEGQRFYALPYADSGADRIFYNREFLAFSAGQNAVLQDAIREGADALITYQDFYKLCGKVQYEIVVHNEFHPDLRVQRPLRCFTETDLASAVVRQQLRGKVVYVRQRDRAVLTALLALNGIVPARIVAGR